MTLRQNPLPSPEIVKIEEALTYLRNQINLEEKITETADAKLKNLFKIVIAVAAVINAAEVNFSLHTQVGTELCENYQKQLQEYLTKANHLNLLRGQEKILVKHLQDQNTLATTVQPIAANVDMLVARAKRINKRFNLPTAKDNLPELSLVLWNLFQDHLRAQNIDNLIVRCSSISNTALALLNLDILNNQAMINIARLATSFVQILQGIHPYELDELTINFYCAYGKYLQLNKQDPERLTWLTIMTQTLQSSENFVRTSERNLVFQFAKTFAKSLLRENNESLKACGKEINSIVDACLLAASNIHNKKNNSNSTTLTKRKLEQSSNSTKKIKEAQTNHASNNNNNNNTNNSNEIVNDSTSTIFDADDFFGNLNNSQPQLYRLQTFFDSNANNNVNVNTEPKHELNIKKF